MSSSEKTSPINEGEDINLISQTKIYSTNTYMTVTSNQNKLLDSLLDKNLQNFNDLAKCEDIDMNYFYGDPHHGTLLDIACRSRGMGEFVKVILKNVDEIDAINKITGKAAIHEAIENSAVDVVEVLIRCHCLIDTKDRNGNTPLHSAIRKNDLQIIELLLEKNRRISYINISNHQNPTPLHIALLKGYTEAATQLLKYPHVDLDFQTDFQGRTCRQIIQQRYPELDKEWLTDPTRYTKNPTKILNSLLYRGETKIFIELASKMSEEFFEENGAMFLKSACNDGYADVVDMLLTKKVDPNVTATAKAFNDIPVLIAAECGHFDVFVKLLNYPKIELHFSKNGTPLHSVIRGMSYKTQRGKIQHHKCLEFLLNEVIPRSRLDIDFADKLGNTALHYAVLFNDKRVIKSLMYAGAHLYCINSKGEIPLTSIKANILEDYLDYCISSSNDSGLARDLNIIFDYTLFVKPSKLHKPEGHETEFFTLIENVPELRKLLKHPVSKSFLHVKWYLVQKYYYINFIFYLIFCFILSCYIFQIHQGTWSSIDDSSTHNTSSWNESYTLLYGPSVIIIFIVILVLRELSQLYVSPKHYIKSPENWIEMLVILTTSSLLVFVNETNANEQSPISAWVIIISCIELIFLLGKHPKFSNHIEIFKTVTFKFFKYLSVYLLLIVSFAFSFYILFKKKKQSSDTLENQMNTTDESTTEFWKDPKLSFLKSVIMLTGEFSAETIPFGPTFSSRHLFFVMFIFLITIVLYNLLNGLAVSDIQAIREDAELVALVSRVKLISQLERLAMFNPLSQLKRLVKWNPCHYLCFFVPRRHCYFQLKLWPIGGRYLVFYNASFFKKVTMFPKTRIYVSPYRENRTSFLEGNFRFIPNLKIPSSIVKQAMQILKNQNEFDTGDETDSIQMHSFKKRPPKFQSIDKLGQHFITQIRGLKIEMDEKIARRDEKLIQNISSLMTNLELKIDYLMESTINEFRIQNKPKTLSLRT